MMSLTCMAGSPLKDGNRRLGPPGLVSPAVPRLAPPAAAAIGSSPVLDPGEKVGEGGAGEPSCKQCCAQGAERQPQWSAAPRRTEDQRTTGRAGEQPSRRGPVGLADLEVLVRPGPAALEARD